MKCCAGFLCVIAIALVASPVRSQNVQVDYRGSTAFSLDLYKQYFNDRQNDVFSPMSIRILLILLYQSSFGQTEKELQQKLFLGNADRPQSLTFQRNSLARFEESPYIKIANKMVVPKGTIINRDFQVAANELRSSIDKVDLRQPEQSARQINTWVEQQTNGLIKNLVTPDMFTNDLVLVLLNTIYFKANWLEPFDSHAVSKNNFKAIDGQQHKIDFMYESGSYNFVKSQQLQADIIEIPYTNGSNFAFWIILPYESSSLASVVQKFDYTTFADIKMGMDQWGLDIIIPKFEIESTIDGKKLLLDYGLRSIFERTELNVIDGNDRVKVDDVKQKTKIIVNTDGTEAATSTYLKAVALSAKPVFFADRPFIFSVVTADTAEPIFIGHFSQPTGN